MLLKDFTLCFENYMCRTFLCSEEYPLKEKEVDYVLPIPMQGKELGPGKSVSIPMWIRGPVKPGLHQVHFLFIYESLQENPKLK